VCGLVSLAAFLVLYCQALKAMLNACFSVMHMACT
jgi:hypothetical protein